jgi:hypothetical protein
MALTELQRAICRLLADLRIESGESYVAGGEEAVAASWDADRRRLEGAGYSVRVLRERPGLVEAEVGRQGDVVLMEWARDSAYRFFPLVEHDELGLALHPFDLATNKLLALVGRREARDWVDVLECHRLLQPLGYLAWAACGKDPGFGPASVLEEARRTGRFSSAEVAELAFSGPAPDAGELAREWRAALDEGLTLVELLPPEEAGTCVLVGTEAFCRLPPQEIPPALAAGTLRFRGGSTRGVLPTLRSGRRG